MSVPYGAKPEEKEKDNKGKAKGKMKLDVCTWDEDAQAWKLHALPSQAALKQVANGEAVYPVDGVCPVDPPTFEA